MDNFQHNPDGLYVCSLNADTKLLKCSSYNEHRHLLFQCSSCNEHRHLLFQTLNPILANDINFRNDCELVRLLYGHEKLKLHVNQILLKTAMNFTGKTLRFSQT